MFMSLREPGISVSIVAGYRLGSLVLIPDRGEGSFLCPLCTPSSGANPASCTMGIGGSFPGDKVWPGVMLTIDPFLVLRLKKGGYTSSPPSAYHIV
jgi:hypothetical protein